MYSIAIGNNSYNYYKINNYCGVGLHCNFCTNFLFFKYSETNQICLIQVQFCSNLILFYVKCWLFKTVCMQLFMLLNLNILLLLFCYVFCVKVFFVIIGFILINQKTEFLHFCEHLDQVHDCIKKRLFEFSLKQNNELCSTGF